MSKTKGHLTRDLLRSARRGEITYRELAELQRAHLEELCPACRRESVAERAEEIPRAEYSAPVRRVRYSSRLRRETERAQVELEAAPALLEALQGHTLEQRLLRIRNTPERFANRFLCELLFEQARACLPEDPKGSQGWAETAEVIARLDAEPYVPHLVRALAFQGNARRAASDFDSALVLFYRARSLMEEHQVVDLELGAELHSFLGSLFTDLRRFDMAAEHLEGAASLYEILEDDEGTAKVLMQLSSLHRYRGDVDAALEADAAVLELVSPHENSRLYLCARFNHTSNLELAGQPQNAREVLVYDAELYEEAADAYMRVQVTWLEGRIAAALGEPEEAERAFLAARDHFVEQEHGYNCARVCLHLASLYHREGRWEALQDAAVQAVQLFQAHALHQDALAALTLLRDAAAARQATAEMIQRIADFLQKAERDPGARFETTN